MQIEELQERMQALLTENETLAAKAEAEKRDFTVEETTQCRNNLAAWETAKENIDMLQQLAAQQKAMTQPTGRKTEADPPQKLAQSDDGQPRIVRPEGRKSHIEVDSYVTSKNGGFRSLGEMAYHVRHACLRGGNTDPRLERLAAASTYGNEGSGSDGGFAIPPDFRAAVMQTILAEDSIAALCDQIPVGGNTFTCPVDETTPWQTSGGVLANWDGEASAATQSKPLLQDRSIKLNKVRALVPMTEELLEDAPAMDAYLRKKAPEKIAFKLTLAILQGTGVGQPLGIINSPALVTVSKESSQTADTLMGVNVVKMYSRMYAPSRSKAVWLVNQDVEPELIGLSLPGRDAVGNAVTGWGGMVYIPPGGLSAAPFGTLLGRPVMPTQACETLGDKGDIIFFDPTQYLLLLKSGTNPRVETSIHLWFDQDLTAFKFVLRVGGMPWWSTTAAARDGSNTYSPYVTLEAR